MVVLLAATGCGGGVLAGPRQTLLAYRDAIRRDDPDTAYGLLASAVGRRISLPEFRAEWRALRPELLEDARALGGALQRTGSLRASAEARLVDGSRVRLSWERGGWAMAQTALDAVTYGTPQAALRALAAAIERRDAAAVLRLLATPVRNNLERQLDERAARIRASLGREMEVKGDRVRLDLGAKTVIELRREPSGWRVVDLD
jgi:hypothetical protein